MLRPFGIDSGTVRTGDATFKGYKLEAFESAFSRYLPTETSQASQSALNTGSNAPFRIGHKGVL
jgi:hypothetical protein